MEETFHVFGFAALERGYNIVFYEGPGHATLVQERKHDFIVDWEKAVSHMVDYFLALKADERSFIDPSVLCLIGMNLGGHLAAKSAAFVRCIDGVWSLYHTYVKAFPESA